jgi:hypothetical protein
MRFDNPPASRYEIVMRHVMQFLPSLVLTIVLFLPLLISGCATSTVNSRKQERAGAYAALSREHQVAVDMGRITFGMNTNAAYIAWGAPSAIEANGMVQTWLYYGSEQRQHKTATARTATGASAAQTGSIEETSVSYPHHVIQARIIFENGLVKEWSRRDRRSLEEDYLEHRR